jgi:DNA-directed RNA polymerase specialized sigma24 family protein
VTDRELLDRYGHTLTDNERIAFELHRVRRLSQYAVADHLEISRSAVRARVREAERKLHRALRSEEAA